MDRRAFLTAAFGLVATPLWARDPLPDLQTQLASQGFTRMQVTRTLLGRTRVLAFSPKFRREIVFNASTGEILRDYWQALSPSQSTQNPQIVDPNSGGSSSQGSSFGGGGNDRNDDRGNDRNDDRDDDRDDDSSRGRGRGHGGEDD